MVLIAGLIGIGLALEAVERRHANRNSSAGKNNIQAQGSRHDSRDTSQATQAQLDEQAFQEVQQYADFQKDLSERVSNDLMKDEAIPASTYPPPMPNNVKQEFSHPPYVDAAIMSPIFQRGVPSPVVIPQQRSEDGRIVWARAYSPALWQCGITQDAFFYFIDCYNEIIKNSLRSEVVNINSMGVGHYSSIAQVLSSQAVPMAVSLAKGSQSLEPTSNYLRQANSQLFSPRGLYAIAIAFNSQQSQIYLADHSYSYPNTSVSNAQSQFVFAAPPVSSENESSSASPKVARRKKSDAKKPQKQQNSSRRTTNRSKGQLKSTFDGALSSGVRGLRSLNSEASGMINRPQEDRTSSRPIGSGEMAQETLYLLIVNDTSQNIGFIQASHGTQPPFHYYQYHDRPVFQVDVSNQPWVYAPDHKVYSTSTFDPSGHVETQQHNDPPPAYDSMMRASYDRAQANGGEYCVPTL